MKEIETYVNLNVENQIEDCCCQANGFTLIFFMISEYKLNIGHAAGLGVDAGDSSHGLPALSRVWQHVKLSDVSLGTRPRDSLVVDEDEKSNRHRRKKSY